LGEVVADAGAADVEAEVVGAAFEVVEVGVGGDVGVAGKIVAGGIDGVEVVLGAELQELKERETVGFAGEVVLELGG